MTKLEREWERLEEDFKGIPDEHLGKCLKEYLEESNHQSWEGHALKDVKGFHKVLADVLLYIQCR